MNIVNAIVTTNRIRALAEDSGLRLVLKNEEIACTSGHTIYLQRPSWDWDEDKITIWEGCAYHEIGHCAPKNKDIFALIKDKGIHMNTRIGAALNAQDDVRQEHEQFGRYAGRDRIMGDSNHLLTDMQLEKGAFSKSHTDEGVLFHQCILAYMCYKMSQQYPACAGDHSRIMSTLVPEVKEKVQTLIDHDHEISTFGENSEGVYDKTLRLLELLGLDPEEEEENAKDKKKAEEQFSEAAKAFAEEMYKHLHTDEDGEAREADGTVEHKGSKNDKPINSLRDTTDRSRGEYRQSDWSSMIVHDYSKNPASCLPDTCITNMVEQGMFLGTRVKKLLQAMSQTRYRHGLKQGKLGKNLYRVTMKGTGSYQQRVFKKKEEGIDMDVAITLQVDCSGSMGDTDFKYGAAAASAIIMSKVCEQLRISHEIVGFTETNCHNPVLRHAVFKSFQGRCSSSQLNSNFKDFVNYEEQNLDGESIMWAAMRLLKQKAKRRILIVFSDGSPCAHRYGAMHITKKVVEELEARRDMEIYGIGIMDKSVRDYYTDYSVIEKTSELEAALLEVIKLKLLNGDQRNVSSR